MKKRPLACIPEEETQTTGQQTPDTYIPKENRATQIRFTATESGLGEVQEESPQSNGQSVRDIVKLFESFNNEKKIKKRESVVSFVHPVMEPKSVRLTMR